MAHVFERLLLATEHGDFDLGAERLAFALAGTCSLPLAAVLPIVSNPEYEALAPQIAAQAEAQASERVRQLAADARRSGVSLDLQVRRGPELYEEILDEAVARGTDLLVIRRRGRRGFLARLLVGEMVAKVVSHAPCSVLVTPRQARMWSRRVLVAVDPAQNDADVIRQAVGVAAQCRLPLTALAVIEAEAAPQRADAERAVQVALTLARAAGLDAEGRVLAGRPHEQILQTAASAGADLIVVGRHGPENLTQVWLGGVTQKVIGLTEQPVLVAIGQETSKDLP